jgi:hypothetical protein
VVGVVAAVAVAVDIDVLVLEGVVGVLALVAVVRLG